MRIVCRAVVIIALTLTASVVLAGPDLDKVLNYMFLDQMVPMRGMQQLFYNDREIQITKETSVGQTFVTGPKTDIVARVRAYFPSTGNWQPGETTEMTLWDSPAKNKRLGSAAVQYENRAWHYNQMEWELEAPVKPNTSYYFEITYAGTGDGKGGRVGVMNDTNACKEGQGYVNGVASDFDVCFQMHGRRAPDRVGNLKKMFARLDLDRPEFAAVKDAVQKEDFETAIAKTVAYFEGRKKPVELMNDGDLPGSEQGSDEARKADREMNSTWHTADMEGWTARGTFTKAYLASGDEKYAKKMNDLLMDWYLLRPPPSESNIGGSPWDDTWASLAVGTRLGQTPIMYSHLHGAKSFTMDCRMATIMSMADHCNTLVKHGGDAAGNWAFTQNCTMLAFSMDYPEFKESTIWQKTACDRLDEALKKDILPDGVETESAPGYQNMAYAPLAGNVYDDLIVKRGLKTPFTDRLSAILERQAEYFMYFPGPDGTSPWLGDWGHEGMNASILADANRFHRDDMLYVATAGKQGTKPKELSKLYPYAGIVTMRSDWGDAGRPYRDARYALVHGVHYGAHGHQDLNGISGLYAYGRELLTDPGANEYGSAAHNLLTSAPSHNLMTIDGEDQDRSCKTAFRNWSTTPIADYLSSYAAAYPGGDYTREFFYVRTDGTPGATDYWMIRDTATGKGTHSLEQRWHFALESNALVDTKTLLSKTAYATGGNLAIMQVTPSRLSAKQTETDTWMTAAWIKDPAQHLPTIVYETKTELPAAFDTVVLPYEGAQMPDVKMKSLEGSANGLDSAFKITQGNIEDLFVFQRAAGKKTLPTEKLIFDGERAVVRRVGGKLHSALLVNGSFLSINGKTVIKAAAPAKWIALRIDAGAIKVYSSSTVKWLAPSPIKGRPLAFEVMNSDKLLQPEVSGDGNRLLIR